MTPAPSRRRVLAGLCAGLAGATGCLGRSGRGGTPPTGDATVRLTGADRFDPETVSIRAGERVGWTHEGTRPQTVTAYEDRIPRLADYFASGGVGREVTARMLYPLVGGLTRGERYSHTFDVPGTYRYFSIPTESAGMTGTVVVE